MNLFGIDLAQLTLIAITMMVFTVARPVAADGIFKGARSDQKIGMLSLLLIIPAGTALMLVLAHFPAMSEAMVPFVLAFCVAAGFFRGMLKFSWPVALTVSFTLFLLVAPQLGLGLRTATLLPLAALATAGLVLFMGGPRGAILTIALIWAIDMLLFFTGTLENLQFAALTGEVQVNSMAAIQIGGSGIGGGDLACAAMLGAWTLTALKPAGRLLAGAIMAVTLTAMMIASNQYGIAVPATCPMLLAIVICWPLFNNATERQAVTS
jgi:hypothetical protein